MLQTTRSKISILTFRLVSPLTTFYLSCLAGYRAADATTASLHTFPVILQLDPANPDLSCMSAILVQTNAIGAFNVNTEKREAELEDSPPRAFTEVSSPGGSSICLSVEYFDFKIPSVTIVLDSF